MKLGKVTKNDPMKRVPLSMHESVNKQLELYRVFYKNNTNEEISMSLLVEEMTKKFMAEDKDFQKFLKAQNAGA
jgi:Uncharacterized conserved small protein